MEIFVYMWTRPTITSLEFTAKHDAVFFDAVKMQISISFGMKFIQAVGITAENRTHS